VAQKSPEIGLSVGITQLGTSIDRKVDRINNPELLGVFGGHYNGRHQVPTQSRVLGRLPYLRDCLCEGAVEDRIHERRP